MSAPLPGIFESIAPLLDHYGYVAVALLVGVEDFGVPVPGETILIAASIYAGAGRLNFALVVLTAWVAAVVGDNIGFLIGRTGGHTLVLKFGRYIFLTPKRLATAEAFYQRYGGRIVLVARFFEGLRQANGLIAGITEMHWARFVLFNAIGAALWVGVWATLGFTAGDHIAVIYQTVNRYLIGALVVALALATLGFLWHRRRHSR